MRGGCRRMSPVVMMRPSWRLVQVGRWVACTSPCKPAARHVPEKLVPNSVQATHLHDVDLVGADVVQQSLQNRKGKSREP